MTAQYRVVRLFIEMECSFIWIATILWIEIKAYAFIELHLAYHIDSTTLADEDYQLISEPEGICSEDSENFVAELSEVLNQSSEDLNFTDFSPTSKGKPRT
jgi:hypothetical protein